MGEVVRIHPGDELAPGGSQTRIERADQPAVLRKYGLQPVIARSRRAQHGGAAVGRAVVHGDDLEVGERLCEEAVQRGRQRISGVEHREQDGDGWGSYIDLEHTTGELKEKNRKEHMLPSGSANPASHLFFASNLKNTFDQVLAQIHPGLTQGSD